MKIFKYFHLRRHLTDEKPLDFTSLESAYIYITGFFRDKSKLWHCDGIDDSPKPVPIDWIRSVMKEFGKVELEILTFDDDHYDLWLSERELRFVDLSDDMLQNTEPRKAKKVSLGRPSSYIPSWEELFFSDAWLGHANQEFPDLPLMLGRTEENDGENVVADLVDAPHLLVAGVAGSGKGMVISQLIHSLLVCHAPDQLRLLLFDPKYLDFAEYQKVPHLLAPILNTSTQLVTALSWLINEMNRRFRLLAEAQVRNIHEYNEQEKQSSMPYIVVVVSELVEVMRDKRFIIHISPLAAKSRAVGIHFILGTQRVDKEVLDLSILANIPWRIALKVQDSKASELLLNCSQRSCAVCCGPFLKDSKASELLLNCSGAEQLLGKGDMLFLANEQLRRIQAGHASLEEIQEALSDLNDYGPQEFEPSLLESLDKLNEEN